MSIEVTGPEKFEFQDLVCVELVLRFRDEIGFEAYIEPLGGEDALIVFGSPISKQIEVQVKGSADAVTLNDLAGYLTHFPPRKASGSLLERLLSSSSRYVLLVASGRCNDSTIRFAASRPWHGNAHSEKKIRLADAKALLKEVERQWRNPSTRLDDARHSACGALAARVLPTQLRDATRRLTIEERVTSEVVRAECESTLRSRYFIPNDRLSDAIEALARVIRTAKQESRRGMQQIDVTAAICKVLRTWAVSGVRPPDYIPRGQEEQWRMALSQNSALLLSGPPRCGKSYAALYIAGSLQALGYEVKQGSDVEDASRFLLETGQSERLYVLDDPLGALQPDPNASRSFQKLRWLIPRLNASRKLIVSQSQDQLFQILGKSALLDCSIANRQWHDLGQITHEFLSTAWEGMAEDAQVRSDVRSVIEPALRGGAVEIELGCLRHLASTADELPPNPNIEQVVDHARRDAESLGTSLVQGNPEMMRLLIGLSIATGPGKPILRRELAFVLQKEESHLPGKMPFGTAYVLGGNVEEPHFPSYDKAPQLSTEIEQQIDVLERRRFITVSNDTTQFAHPFYRAAAQSLFQNPTSVFTNTALSIFQRTLFSLAPATASAAVRNATWLFQAFNGKQGQTDLLKNLSEGLESIFPIVRDLCFEFLLQHLDSLPEEQRTNRAHWVDLAVALSITDVLWHEGQAWVPHERNALKSLEEELRKVTAKEIKEDLAYLTAGEPSKVAPDKAAHILAFYAQKPELLSLEIATALFSFEEALIRAKVARLWFSVPREKDLRILERVFQDRHPAIVLNIFKACVESWRQLPKPRRKLLADELAKAANSDIIAVALIPRLVVFDRVEFTGNNPPWQLFEKIMPVVLASLPLGASIEDARLYSVMGEASRTCSSESIISICESWVEWLEREVKVRLPTDYEFGVTDIVITATRARPELRSQLVRRLLALPGTGPLLYVLSDLQSHWKYLRDDERTWMLELLTSKRTDQLWLHALALTRKDVPPEIQTLVLGSNNVLGKSPQEIIELLPPKLLSDTVSVHCGRPGVFWNLAHRSQLFDKVIRVIEQQSSHPDFETAFHEAVSDMEDSRIVDIVNACSPRDLDKLFDLLLAQRVKWTSNFFPMSWSTLLARGNLSQRTEWLKQMARVAPACINDLTELREWLANEDDQQDMIMLLRDDLAVEAIVLDLRKDLKSKEEELYLIERLKGILADKPPRLFRTYDRIKNGLQNAGIRLPSLFGEIDSLRKKCFTERNKIEDQFRDTYELPAGWITP